MKPIVVIIFSFLFLSGEGYKTSFSGNLKVHDALFSYYAEGEGIPCIVFAGSENLGRNMYPKIFLEHFNLIHTDANQIESNDIATLTLDDIAAEIEKVRKHLGLDKIAVMGHSMFSVLPLEYALRYPDNISYAIATGAIPFFTEEFNSAAEEYWDNAAAEERKKILNQNVAAFNEMDKSTVSADEVFIAQYEAYVPYRFKDPYHNLNGIWNGVTINMEFVNHYWGNLLNNMDNTEKYKTIKSSVLVVSGKYDFGCPYFLWEDLDCSMDNLTLLVFEDAGHNPMLEIPGEFTDALVQWTEDN